MSHYGDIRIDFEVLEDAHNYAIMLLEDVSNSDVRHNAYWKYGGLDELAHFINYTYALITEHKSKNNGVVHIDH